MLKLKQFVFRHLLKATNSHVKHQYRYLYHQSWIGDLFYLKLIYFPSVHYLVEYFCLFLMALKPQNRP